MDKNVRSTEDYSRLVRVQGVTKIESSLRL
jgi:hypothetical protein